MAYLFLVQLLWSWGYAADRVLGLEGFLTRQATRLICLLGGQNSFAVTERLLKECCGWTISDERIRQACQAESPRIAVFRAESPAVAKAFADAPGDVEFQTDAAKVYTTEGWRDMKIGIFARRERGEPSTPENWDNRHLPAPATRVAFAAIETIDDFAPRWSKWAVRLGIEDLSTITVLGDGAEWICNAALLRVTQFDTRRRDHAGGTDCVRRCETVRTVGETHRKRREDGGLLPPYDCAVTVGRG